MFSGRGQESVFSLSSNIERNSIMLERIFGSNPVERSPEAQARLDQKLKKLSLYQFTTCPYCLKVRRAMHRLNMNIPSRDTRKNAEYKAELQAGGGKTQVPCLRIENGDGDVQWLYESSDIVKYLEALSGEVA